jgi:hypothetical protein
MMPATSLKQKKFMDAVAHNPAFAEQAGVPQSVGKDFSEASKGMKFKGGPKSRADSQAINRPKTNQGSQELFKQGGKTMATKKMNPFAKFEASAKDKAMDKKEMGMKKMANGGYVKAADGVATKGKTKGTQISMPGNKGMKKGGKV